MNGGPSQVDTFDPKPALDKYKGSGPKVPAAHRPSAKGGGLLPSPFKFGKHGQSGIEVSELFPQRRPGASTTSASSARCTPTCPTTSRRC